MLVPMAGFCTIQDIMNDIEQFDFNETQIEQSLADYKNIQDSYIQLPRGRFNQYDLVLLKYKMEVFNYWFSQKLIQNIDKLPHDNKKLQDLFDSFPFILKDNQAKKIKIRSSKHAPEKFLDVKTLEDTRWSLFNNWKDYKLASNYPVQGEEAYFHGIKFKTGDIIVGDTNTYGYELLSTTRDTKQTGNHSAIFVMMHDKGRSIPTVFDMHAGGIRATPLSHYLHDKISTYLEIYRLTAEEQRFLQPNWQNQIRNYFENLISKQQKYKFDFTTNVDNNDKNEFTCTELVTEALHAGGISSVLELTLTESYAYDLIVQFGTISREYLAPADFAYDKRFSLVGYTDMLNIKTNLLIKLESDVLTKVLQQQAIKTNKVLHKIKAKSEAIEKIRTSESFAGKLLRFSTGIKVSSFPAGEPNLIAFSLFFDEEVEKTILYCTGSKKVARKITTTIPKGRVAVKKNIPTFDPCYTHFKLVLNNLSPKFDVENFLIDEKNVLSMRKAMRSLLQYFHPQSEEVRE